MGIGARAAAADERPRGDGEAGTEEEAEEEREQDAAREAGALAPERRSQRMVHAPLGKREAGSGKRELQTT
jgi:hypothetical protein